MSWDPCTETWMDFEGGHHVAIDCAVTYLGGHEVAGTEGVTAHEMSLDLGAGRTLESTVTVRHPIRRAPHGEAG